MSDEDIRRAKDASGKDKTTVTGVERPGTDSEQPATPLDSVVSALRDIPRLRSIEEEAPGKASFRPPPPTVSRISGLTQGCGSLMLTVMAVIMLLSAFSYGFYLWGPALLLVGGLVLVVGTIGVWRGNRVPVLVSIAILVPVLVIGYYWESFIGIAGRLTPLGGVGMLVGPAAGLVTMVLIGALVAHLISLVYWRRLFPSTTRGIMLWTFGTLGLVAVAVVLHFTQQDQRDAWISENLDAWRAEAATDTLDLGSSLNITLGYTFSTVEEDDKDYLDVHLAELNAAIEANADIVRLNANGDILLEAREPRLFNDEDSEAGLQTALARVERQQAVETSFMEAVLQSGLDLMLVDYQYSPYLLVTSYQNDNERLPWTEFTAIQEHRVRHYASLYQPAYYEILNEPSQYAEFSAVAEPEGETLVDAWIAQAVRLSEAVQEESPGTRVGVSLGLQQELDEQLYVRLLELDAIDFIGFRLFQPAAFEVLEDMFAEFGHPADYGKDILIMETWFGACLAPQRSQELDAKWLEMTAAFAAKERMQAVLASDFGCFVTEGGTRTATDPELDERTQVWQAWADLIAAWNGSGNAEQD